MTAPPPLRLLLILPYSMPPGRATPLWDADAPKEKRVMNYETVAPHLADVDWDLHPGPVSHHGTSLAETAEEFLPIAAGTLPLVRQACEGGRHDAIVLLGGADPGLAAARAIARPFGIPVTAPANAQMHLATMVASRFSVIDVSEPHAASTAALVAAYGFRERCASIRILDCPLPRDGVPGTALMEEKAAADAGRPSAVVERAVEEAEAAIAEDGAEAITIGVSALFWLRPHLERRLAAGGWDVPVLEGYAAAIAMAKMMAGLKLTASGLTFPPASVRRARRVKRP